MNFLFLYKTSVEMNLIYHVAFTKLLDTMFIIFTFNFTSKQHVEYSKNIK